MIVRRLPQRVQLITQPDHAHLAGRIMEHCVALKHRPRRDAILLAIAEHDNGWEEVDASPSVDPHTGRIVDFVSAPATVRQGVWPRAISRVPDPWAAALVAHHAATVYARFRPDPAWTSFFADMEAARTARVEASGLSLDDLLSDYLFLRLGDLISLMFCTRSTEDVPFETWTIRLVDDSVIVRPDLFGGATVPFDVRAKEIADRVFRLDAELRAACDAAETMMLHGEVR